MVLFPLLIFGALNLNIFTKIFNNYFFNTIYFFSRLLFDFKNSNFKIYFYFLGCLFLISLHLLINNYWEDQTLTNHSLFGLFFFYIIFFLVFFYYEKIISIFHDGKKVFLILFILSSILGIINNNYDAPFFCGGIPDIFNFFLHTRKIISIESEMVTIQNLFLRIYI